MIGYYAHHVGTGHVSRAVAIARFLRSPITGLSSCDRPPDWRAEWVTLARDDEPAPPPRADVTAGGTLHWAPVRHDGLRTRMVQIADWIGRTGPTLIVADVSVEVAALARLMGIPVVSVALPGIRDDPAHLLAYRQACAVIAPWPRWVPVPREMSFLTGKLHCVGAFSSADGRAADRDGRKARRTQRRVLLLAGGGGTAIESAQVSSARAATPDWSWHELGPPSGRWIADPWSEICAADVVITHAGQTAIAEVAAACRPAIVLPQQRPYREQHHTADVLERAGLAIVRRSWPEADKWPPLLDDAARLGGHGWRRWASGDGAQRAAALLDRWAGEPSVA
jgi:hypothetical protein